MKLIQRKSLPPKLAIRFGRFVWTSMWQAMMSQLAPRDPAGAYVRPASQFRDRVSAAAGSRFPPASGRYRLYVGWGCPWAHRTLMVRALKGLEEAIAITTVSPSPESGGWVFDREEEGCRTLAELYQRAQPGYAGRNTVPVLWDSETKAIVNNESAEIIVMLDAAFNEFARCPDWTLYPPELQSRIDTWNETIYHAVNNGVYRCGFAQTQAAYAEACQDLFAVLDEIDTALAESRYLCGNSVTLADVRLFPTLFRFDAVYYGLFKCNRRRICDFKHLGAYLRDLYQLPGVADTCRLDAVKQEYYSNLFPLNPGGIVPAGPDIDLTQPHGRETVGQALSV